MCGLAKVLESWLHSDHHLEHLDIFACFLKEPHGQYAHINIRVVHLGYQQAKHPRHGLCASADEHSQMVRSEHTDRLQIFNIEHI